MDTLNLDAWTNRQIEDHGQITEMAAAQIHATLGEGPAPKTGDVLPPLWHWCAFANAAPVSMLGRDGHPRGGMLLPPVALGRRMWGSGALSFHRPLHVGEAITRQSRVRSVVDKMGKTGPMVCVTVDHEIYGEAGLAVKEQQDIVFLEIPDSYTPPRKRALDAPVSEEVETSETLLFRFSAITFNAHRIHYDKAYAQEVEHYPGLVVHGPLQAMLLMRNAVRARGRAPIFFDFRGVHPMFAGAPCAIASRMDAETESMAEALSLWTGQDGHQCMQAQAVWEGTQ